MEDTSDLELKEAERMALLEEASRIVQAAEAESRAPNAVEDAAVLGLMTKVMNLEE
jgi:hypothetical protein